METLRAAPIVPFAHGRSSSGTRFGIAASTANQNGSEAIDATNPSATRAAGSRTKTNATQIAALRASETIITRRRSKRSAMCPATGVRNPVMPKLKSSVAASQTAEPVRSYTR